MALFYGCACGSTADEKRERAKEREGEDTTKDNNDDDKDIMKRYDEWDYIPSQRRLPRTK